MKAVSGAAAESGHGQAFLAVDIGASSGRVILGTVRAGGIIQETVHRFPNRVQLINGGLRWDFEGLFDEVLIGLGAAASVARNRGQHIVSIGIDTWAVDYGRVDAAGKLRAAPFSYRDARCRSAVAEVHRRIDPARLYAHTGIQFLQFNTLYQLVSEADLLGEPQLEAGEVLLIPDLIVFRFTGQRRTESTNASTTGLLDANSGQWVTEFLTVLELPLELFPPLVQAGETIGTLLPEITSRTGLDQSVKVVAVGSHDTASAVVAVPAETQNFGYISSGTWSLVGVELARPIVTEPSRLANFTNERGVDGSIRYLRNTGGLWLLNECLRSWSPAESSGLMEQLMQAAARLPSGPLIDVDDPRFIAPGDMPKRISTAVAASGKLLLPGRAAVVRCILDSLADGYARTLREVQQLTGRKIDVVHVVGGGSQNGLLCQLTANATGKEVIAGPVVATALGNLLIQARAAGLLKGGLADLRREMAASQTTVRYRPGSVQTPAKM